jgi:ABC-type multidrug transport system fused ATPase/permease subunit
MRMLQIFGQEERESRLYADLLHRGYAMARRYAYFQGSVEGSGRLAVNAGTLALLGLGGVLVLQGHITVGTLLAFNVFNLFISLGLASLAASLAEVGKAVGALQRLSEVMGSPAATAAEPLINPSPSSSPSSSLSSSSSGVSTPGAGAGLASSPATTEASSSPSSSSGADAGADDVPPGWPAAGRVEFRDVWFKYEGQREWVLKGFSMTIPAGSMFAMVGPSGGGKSSAISLLLGLYQPQASSFRGLVYAM